jgi:hypothetical protein
MTCEGKKEGGVLHTGVAGNNTDGGAAVTAIAVDVVIGADVVASLCVIHVYHRHL